jgi:arylsulfatase A-like enzyme
LYEGGIITPMIAYWPGTIEPGRVTDHMSGFQDVLPTLAELVDVKPPDNIDGISFLPTLFDRPDKQQKHDYVYWEFTEQGGKRALRQGDWKVVQLKVGAKNPKPPELYNLKDDPAETTNLAGENPERLKELVKLMNSAHTPSEKFPLFASEKD